MILAQLMGTDIQNRLQQNKIQEVTIKPFFISTLQT
jgi:hypothetical protein